MHVVHQWSHAVLEEVVHQSCISPQKAEKQLVGGGLALRVQGTLLLASLGLHHLPHGEAWACGLSISTIISLRREDGWEEEFGEYLVDEAFLLLEALLLLLLVGVALFGGEVVEDLAC